MLPRVREFYGLEKLWEDVEPPSGDDLTEIESNIRAVEKAAPRKRAAPKRAAAPRRKKPARARASR